MDFALVRNWRLMVGRGALAVLFGVAVLSWPGVTLLALVLLFGAYTLIDGIGAIASAVGEREETPRWWALVAEGVVGIGVGLVVLLWPGITGLALLALLAVWAVITGVLKIVTAVRLREQVSGEWAMGTAGALSVLFGLLLLMMPVGGAMAIIWLIGPYAILFGVLLIALGIQLRSLETLAR